jgi:hypothetical protein
MKKYELVKSDTIIRQGKTLYRTKYLIDIPRHNIEAGDLGGFLESERNLSHDGDCVVLDNAMIFGNTRVYGDAMVYDNARVFGDARVSDDARVYGDAKVFDNALVYGDARVYGYAWVFGNAKVNSGKHKDINIDEDLIIRSSPLWKVLYG